MKRRDFLKLSSATAVAISVGITACNDKRTFVRNEVPDKQRIRIGLIGVGSRGSGILSVLQNVPEFKVVALCDSLNFRLEAARSKVPNSVQTFNNYQDLLSIKGLDAVIIATPLHEHHRMVMDALDANLNIMCEKALAYNIEQSIAIKEEAQHRSKVFQISYQYQLNPVFKTIKNIINQGYLGKVSRIEATWDRNADWRRPLPQASIVPELRPEEIDRHINWRMYKAYSGGLNAELGSHQYNMIDNLLGAHPIRVMGTGGIDYWQDGRETFDNVHMLFDYPEGVKVGFHSGTSNKYEGYQLKIYGKKATIVAHNMASAFIYPEGDEVEKSWEDEIDSVSGASIKIIDKEKKRNIKPGKEHDIVYPSEDFGYNATWLLYKNFASAIRGEEELLLGLKDGYQSAISVHLANKAVREGKIVNWLPEYNFNIKD